MAVTKSLLLAFIFAAFMVLASATVESFATSSMIYTGPVTPGGDNVTLEGTIQEIFHQILKLNPSYKPEDFPDAPHSPRKVSSKLEKRIPGDIICDPSGTKRAWRKHIEEGVAYLKRAPQASLCRVRNRSCSRISCSWDSGIFLCNDRDSWFEEFCPLLGNYADEILRGCQQSRTKVAGQKFDPQNYNVLVKFDKC
ncbi:hypothetical protein H112_08597 [Trichophyton rubrum D6]|uniref:Secreted protein n=3 Tax=Trichophyton TaxID=5550 RepID=F2SFB3_TRIRC|nr:uncharacterized protein TERG_01153 [Trichophyton rubrum CBS 118892]EZF10059.1 hypothetical protein H100_08619 [Trichophyton rubrum MR850]EZF36984.1 hypothetical protein H102_08578 [Trichophyton rubrum CBS 100081]EZF47600.1 hypothetical protein H103_08601 [Trichophyton rubrum CBS 288.86]EZF58276.1 hypothetical protein H104_08553 [Trichophyton rubrum CBS 289.86]EZF68822.1 hypothetical protein H105_08606 [Trichophyton soudanense CBS 452.61]EZF79497.1 hypothetical protein H110_08602 [Trichophy